MGSHHDDTTQARTHNPSHPTEVDFTLAEPDATGLPERAGAYRILRRHAAGGVGEVFVGLDEPLRRQVAIKQIRPELADRDEARARFLIEAEVTGRLEHPGVVPVYAMGQDDEGRPFYAMRLIRGESLKEAVARFFRDPAPDYRSMAFRDLLSRFLDVCNVIAYAHDRGVLHRDLKPSNVMLGKFGETLVVDWGLAKLLDRDDPVPNAVPSTDPDLAAMGDEDSRILPPSGSGVQVTQAGTMVGTPRYMSPEQTFGAPESVGPPSDVYSLGATLYHLLTGGPPLADLANVSDVIRRVSDGAIPPPASLRAGVPPSLDAICRRAMAPTIAGRYATPLELAADLHAWLADAPIAGIRERLDRRLTRWERRNRVLIRVGGAALVAVTITSLIATWAITRARGREGAALAAEHAQRTAAERQEGQLRVRACELLLERGLQLADAGEYGKALLWLARAAAEVPEAQPTLDRAIRTAITTCDRLITAPRAILAHPGARVVALATAGDGRVAATGADDGTVRLWEVATGEPRGEPLAHEGSVVRLEHAGRAPALLVATTARIATVRDPRDGRPLAGPLAAGGPITAAAISGDGRRVALGTDGGQVRIWHLPATEPIAAEFGLGDAVAGLAFSDDGRLVAAGARGGLVRVLDAGTGSGTALEVRHPRPLQGLGFRPDGRALLTYGGDGTARVWDVPSGEPIGLPMRHRGAIGHAEFRPDGEQVLTTGLGTVVRLWDAATGQEQVSRLGSILHHSYTPAAAYGAGGLAVVTGSLDRTARLWEVEDQRPLSNPLHHPGRVVQVALTPDGRALLTRDQAGGARIWAVGRGAADHESAALPGPVLSLAVTADGRHVLAGGASGVVHLCDARTGAPVGPGFAHPGLIWAVALSPDGGRAAVAGFDGQARLFEVATGRALGPPMAGGREIVALAFSPDGATLAAGGRDRAVRLFDAHTAAPIGEPLPHPETVLALAFTLDGRQLLTACEDGQVRSWDARTRAPGPLRLIHEDGVRALALHPDGRTLATGTLAGNARLWDLTTGRPIGAPMPHDDWVTALAFSPNGATLATAGTGRALRFWDVPAGHRLGPDLKHPGAVWSLVFAPDGASVLTGCEDRRLRTWPVPTPSPGDLARLSRLALVRSAQQLNPDGTYRTLPDADWEADRQALDPPSP